MVTLKFKTNIFAGLASCFCAIAAIQTTSAQETIVNETIVKEEKTEVKGTEGAANADAAKQEAQPAALTKVLELEGITEYHLANGVKVLLFPDGSKPQFTINVTVNVGSRHEGYGESGMAHLLEHMLFKGCLLYTSPSPRD